MLYSYRAVDKTGTSSAGEREAGSERELAEALRREGLLLLEIVPPRAAAGRSQLLASALARLRRPSLVERMTFARNLAVMIGAGLALTRGLEALEQQSANPAFRSVLASLRDGVVKGRTLAESMRPHEKVFGSLFINMVESGEISGNLEKVLKILARQMARDHELRSRVRGALIYPAIVVGALIAVGVLMMVWVVPTLTRTFTELGIALPLTTRIIITGSNVLVNYGWYAAGLVILLAAAFPYLLRRPGVRHAADTLILKVPIFGPLVQRFNSARFARTLASLISSGIPITRSLEVTASVLGNVNFRAATEAAREAIGRGHQLAGVLGERPELFPPLVIQMIQVGEETGTLSRMLLRLALFYEEEVAAVTKNLSSVVEPVLMIAIGAIVGFFAVSMIQPIYGGLGNL